MKMKKVLINILMLITLICCLMAVACSNKQVELVDFDDITVNGSIYSDFSLAGYVYVSDTDGNLYKATVSVVDADGNEVETLFNRFEPTKMEEYTATISVKVGGKTQTRKIIIDVKDRSVPQITLTENIYVGTVNSEYILPTVEVRKITEEEITPEIKVFYQNGESSTEVELSNENRFTPQNSGDYLMQITATDKYGTLAKKTYSFYVRPQMAENVLEDFGDEKSKYNFTAYGCGGANAGTYYEEFGGKTGVVYVSSPGSQNCSALRFNKTYEELVSLTEFDNLVFTIYLDMEGETHPLKVGGKFEQVKCRQWVDFVVSRAQLLDLVSGETDVQKWDNFCKKYCVTGNGAYMFSHQDGHNAMHIYVDNVKLEKRAPLAANMLEDFNHPSTAENVQYNAWGTCNGTGSGSWWAGTYHETYQGATGVVELKAHNDSKGYQIPIRFSRTESELAQIMQNLESVTYRIYSPDTNYWFVAGKKAGVVIQKDTWTEVTVTKAELLGETSEADYVKAHCNTGSGVGNTYNNQGRLFIDSVTFTLVNA